MWLWRYYYVIYMLWYIYYVLHVAPYTHDSNMPYCINNNNLNKSNLTFAHGKYIGLLAMIMLLHNALANTLSPQLMVWYRQMLYHLQINYFGIPFKGDQTVISIRLLLGIIPLSFRRQLPHYQTVLPDSIIHSTTAVIILLCCILWDLYINYECVIDKLLFLFIIARR